MKILEHPAAFEVIAADGRSKLFHFEVSADRRKYGALMSKKQALQAAKAYAGKGHTIEPTKQVPWSQRFEDPIPHPDGGTIRTLRQAGVFIMALSKREAATEHWQLALHCLIEAAEGRGPLMHARIGMLKALNHGQPERAPRNKKARAYRIIR